MKENRFLMDLFDAIATTAKDSYVFFCDIATDESRWSKAAVDYFGLPGEFMHKAGTIWEEHIHPEDRAKYRQSIDDIFAGKALKHDMEYRARAKDGSYVMCTCRGAVVKNDDGTPMFFAGTIRNHGVLDSFDPVTNLNNLYSFFSDIKARCKEKKKSTVLVIGLSQFSGINDIYGYTFGNDVLKELAFHMLITLGPFGKVYRLEGTKFGFVTDELTEEQLEEKYKALQEHAKSETYVHGRRVNLVVNGGVVEIEDFNVSSHTIYACVRSAFETSRNQRHGELVYFENVISDSNKMKLQKVNVIRESIINDCKGFYLCYQPFVNKDTEELEGVEALVRWKGEPYGSIEPNDFIPVLENDNAFFELGNWILYTALMEARPILEKKPDFILNVNLSYGQIERSKFRTKVIQILNDTGFPPENLCLEITERCRFLDMDLLASTVKFLRSYGIRIALDDFGTGFSSMNLLREFPIDVAKIDRSFVTNIDENPVDQVIVKTLTMGAAEMNIKVTVEGIETRSMRDCMRQYKVHSFQGFYYSSPHPMDEIVEMYGLK